MFDAVTYANNTGDNFTKNILKVYLGKMFFDKGNSQQAMEIYNEQITYFAKEKIATGALLSWYLIAQATEKPQNAIDIAVQALDIAKNPNINNYFFIIKLKTLLAKLYSQIGDFQMSKMYLEDALLQAQKNDLKDLECHIYYEYANLCKKKDSPSLEYKELANRMYDNVLKYSTNDYLIDITKEEKAEL